MEVPLLFLGPMGTIRDFGEVAGDIVVGEGIGQALSCLLVLGECNPTDPIPSSSNSSSTGRVGIFLLITYNSIHGWLIAFEGVACLLVSDTLHDGLLDGLVLLL